MALRTDTKLIDGMSFAVTQLTGFKALRMFGKLGRILTPALTKGLAGIETMNLKDIDIGKLGAALEMLFANASGDEVESITRELLAAATVDNKPLLGVLDVLLAGRVDTILKVLLFAIEVNFGSFFVVLRDLKSAAMAKGSSSNESTISPSAGQPIDSSSNG